MSSRRTSPATASPSGRLEAVLQAGVRNRAKLLSVLGGPVPVAGRGVVVVRPGSTPEQQARLEVLILKMLSGQPITEEDAAFLDGLEEEEVGKQEK